MQRMGKFYLTNNVGELEDHTQLYYLYDERGILCGFLPDLLWRAWIAGHVPLTIGEHELDLEIPDTWHQVVDGKKEPIITASATVRVSAAVLSFAGRAEQHSLVAASDNTMSKYRASVSFDTSRSEYPVSNYHTESDLQAFLAERPVAVRVGDRSHQGSPYRRRTDQLAAERAGTGGGARNRAKASSRRNC